MERVTLEGFDESLALYKQGSDYVLVSMAQRPGPNGHLSFDLSATLVTNTMAPKPVAGRMLTRASVASHDLSGAAPFVVEGIEPPFNVDDEEPVVFEGLIWIDESQSAFVRHLDDWLALGDKGDASSARLDWRARREIWRVDLALELLRQKASIEAAASEIPGFGA